MSDEQSYGHVAAAYHRGRPTYPAEAVRWLLGPEPRIVLELGAGTGRLTEELVRQGHAVHATDPDPQMLEVLREQVPDCSTRQASAEDIPANDASVDVVVVGQAFDSFDHERALPEIARVLRPDGHLALIHHERDARIPWVRRLGNLIGNEDQGFEPKALVASSLFGFVEDHSFKHWQDVNRDSIVDLALSRPAIASLDTAAQEERIAQVLAFYDDYGRGMDGMQVPYVTRCFKAKVVDRDDADEQPADDDTVPPAEQDAPVVSDGTDTDMLLIDFR